MKQSTNFLFVYGTLRSYFINSFSLELRKRSRLLGEVYTFGELYDIAGYPSAVCNPDSATRIHGELYELIDPNNIFKWLDSYEEISEHNQQDSEYRRETVEVYLNGQKLNAWMYKYNRSVKNLMKINDGNFVKHTGK